MNKNLLEAIIPELETVPEFFVPIKKLWKGLPEKDIDTLSLEDFTALIREDKRFVIQEAHPAPWEDDLETEEQMEELGYYTGPRVRLKSRVPTKEDMIRIISQHAQKVVNNLVKAYETRPKDLPEEEEGRLIDAMIKAKKLKEGIEKSFEDKEDEKESESH